MGVIDKYHFEARGGVGCSNSDFSLHRTTCCGAYCVEDEELLTLYYDPAELTKHVLLNGGIPCPCCGSARWDLVEIQPTDDVPPEWWWASKLE
jgi:hypothetical protein